MPETLGINPFSSFSQANGCITELYCDLNLHLCDYLWCWVPFQVLIVHSCVCFSKVLHLLSGPFVSWKPKYTVSAHPGRTRLALIPPSSSNPFPGPISPPTWILDKRTLRFPTLVSRPHCLTHSWPTSLPLCRALHHLQFLLNPSQPALPHRCPHQGDQRCYGATVLRRGKPPDCEVGRKDWWPAQLAHCVTSILASHQADLQLRRDRS